MSLHQFLLPIASDNERVCITCRHFRGGRWLESESECRREKPVVTINPVTGGLYRRFCADERSIYGACGTTGVFWVANCTGVTKSSQDDD